MSSVKLPSSLELESALINVLLAEPGGLTNDEISAKVISLLQLNQSQIELMHAGNRTELEYRLAWARTKASKKNLIRRIAPGTWKATN